MEGGGYSAVSIYVSGRGGGCGVYVCELAWKGWLQCGVYVCEWTWKGWLQCGVYVCDWAWKG